MKAVVWCLQVNYQLDGKPIYVYWCVWVCKVATPQLVHLINDNETKQFGMKVIGIAWVRSGKSFTTSYPKL